MQTKHLHAVNRNITSERFFTGHIPIGQPEATGLLAVVALGLICKSAFSPAVAVLWRGAGIKTVGLTPFARAGVAVLCAVVLSRHSPARRRLFDFGRVLRCVLRVWCGLVLSCYVAGLC